MWTPIALASELRRYRGRVWRVVEAQHRISTNRLAADLDEQRRLEELAETAKPDLPSAAGGLHYLLASPFRYGHGVASRFRKSDERPGVFYASEAETTTIAEIAYWRLRFFSRTPGFAPPATTSEHSSFSVEVRAARALDLTRPPFTRDAAKWKNPADYSACQALATEARRANAQLIRSRSVRDPGKGLNIALFDPAAFASAEPVMGRTWHLRHERGRLVALAAFPASDTLAFTAQGFGLHAEA
ncbi:MAG: RES family NAD+ phosphorylase [Sphingomonadaceae bacterium]|nr:RES family NAD+ phosphorylase [Sphingomonadaceae bacterium]